MTSNFGLRSFTNKGADVSDDKSKKRNEIVTPKARLSFPQLFEPVAYEDKEARFSAQFLIPKNVDIKDLKNACAKVGVDFWGKENFLKFAKDKSRFVMPFKDGEEKTNAEGEVMDGYEGCIAVSASTKYQPEVVDKKVKPVMSEDIVYGGCYVRALLSPYAWEYKDKKGNIIKRGIGFNLLAVQKVEEGERFTKRADINEFFESLDDDDDEDISTDDDSDLDFL